jgi:hypothetical protein
MSRVRISSVLLEILSDRFRRPLSLQANYGAIPRNTPRVDPSQGLSPHRQHRTERRATLHDRSSTRNGGSTTVCLRSKNLNGKHVIYRKQRRIPYFNFHRYHFGLGCLSYPDPSLFIKTNVIIIFLNLTMKDVKTCLFLKFNHPRF